MGKELREIYDFGKLNIITEKSKLPKYALAKLSYSFAKSDSQNANHRTYPESLLSREINRKSEELRKGKIAGQLEHPLSGITKLDKVAHVLNSVSYDRNTKLASAESFVLNTSKGRDFMVMLDAELSMGASMRGWGNLKNGYVQSDWKLDTLDFVLSPSFGSDATIDQNNIIESANSIFNGKDYKGGDMKGKMMGLSESYIDEMMESVHSIYIDEGTFSGSLEDFKKENGAIVLASILVEEGKMENTDEALKHLEKFGEVKRIPTAPIKKVTASEVFLEARMAGVNPKVYAEKMNANIEKSSDLNPGEIIFALAEARQSGFDTGDEKGRKRILEIHRQQKNRRVVLTEEERAVAIAKKMGVTPQYVKEIWAVEKKKKKKAGHYSLLASERMASGFGSEIRSEPRRISKKIMEK